MDRAPSLQDIPSETKDKPVPVGMAFDYKEIAREVLARGAPVDRAPNLQDIPNQKRDKPAPVGTAFDYKEMAREVLARIDQRLADLGADPNTPPDESEEEPDGSEQEFGSETGSRLMSSEDQAALVRWAWRGLIGLLLSASLVAAVSFLWSHGDTATESVAQSVPRLDQGSTTPVEKPEPGPPCHAAIADAAPAQAAQPPRTAPDYDKPNPAPVPPELTELMRKVDRNIAGLAQAVTDLRLAHQQATTDNAKTVEDIRASLDQMTRAMAMASAPEARASDQVTPAQTPSPGHAGATPSPGHASETPSPSHAGATPSPGHASETPSPGPSRKRNP